MEYIPTHQKTESSQIQQDNDRYRVPNKDAPNTNGQHHGQGLFSVMFKRQPTYFERHLKLLPKLRNLSINAFNLLYFKFLNFYKINN